MPAHWSNYVQPHAINESYMGYDGIIEHDGHVNAHSLQALASGLVDDMTPKLEHDMSQGYIPAEYDPMSAMPNHAYDPPMSTPPLSPSTTISSLPTDEHSDNQYSSDEQSVPSSDREEIRRGKQPAVPPAESEEQLVQDDSDWYGMEYALEQSRYDYPGYTAVWPPTAGESSTSDAAFVAMYDGHIYPEDVAYWYEHWRKWHRALAREEKRRRDRAASDAKRTRTYNHATYVEWERAQHKRRMAQAAAQAVGSKPLSATRYRSSTCLF